MDHSWRRPPGGNNNISICPICSISHFPFCPPLIQNPPRFHHPNYFHHPPPPFHPNHHHTSSSSIINHNHNHPIDIRPPPTWHGTTTNPTFHPTPYDNNNNIHPTTRAYYDHHNNNKRMKVDNERILKLIHDHGNGNGNVEFKAPQHFHPPLTLPPKNPSLFPLTSSSSSGAPLYHYYSNNNAPPPPPPEEFHSSSPLSSDKHNFIDASHIFKQPHRASRPHRFVIILRGLPGSGKSYLAKLLRDVEVENGGEAPRIHSMDDYFMIEVEKAEESELSKSSKSQVMKSVMEYCYEPEMEEAYRASMLKAFKKTLDEGVYSFIIVDDRNLRVADFAQFWATAKRSGYEVYLVEASYKDPTGCAARNVHNFTLPDIQKMAGQWEEAPSLYLKMDIKSLLHGDGLVETDIQEVDMDMEDEDATDASQDSDVRKPHVDTKNQVDDFRPHDEAKDVTVTNHQIEEVKDLSRSKWSANFDAEEDEKNSGAALSGLVQAYSSKEAKSVSWGDQGGNVGFSISATRKTNTRSLVMGPGPGYNLKSNPLAEEEYIKPAQVAVEPSTQSVFQEQIRAERQSFKAVFDKRRQRIGGFHIDDD